MVLAKAAVVPQNVVRREMLARDGRESGYADKDSRRSEVDQVQMVFLRAEVAATPLLKLQKGSVDLGEVPKAEHRSDVDKLDERVPKRADRGHSVVIRAIAEFASPRQSLHLISGGGGNRTSGETPGSDDSRTVSRTGIDVNTSKEHEENASPDILMTMSQIPVPDVTRELAEVGAMFSVFRAVTGEPRRS